MVSAKVTPRRCTAGYTDGRLLFCFVFLERNLLKKTDRMAKKRSSWSFPLFLLLSSVCRLAALITALHKSHLSICGLVITQKASVWDMLLATLYCIREAQGQWSSISSSLFFLACALVILDSWPQNRAELLLSDNQTIDFLTKLMNGTLFGVYWYCITHIKEEVEYDPSHFSPVGD